MSTPHISAGSGAFAEAVMLPGDPRRAEYIASRFLDDAIQVTEIRNMSGFTGTYEGMPISVMGTGIGIPSLSVYVTELIREYGCKRLVRVGSCGGIAENVGIRDVVLAVGACTDSALNRARYNGWDFAATADLGLLRAAADAAEASGVSVRAGNVHTSDAFYNPTSDSIAIWDQMGVLAVEMEAAGLYAIAHEEQARALAILTVSDHVRTHEAISPEDRESTLNEMVVIALNALRLDASQR